MNEIVHAKAQAIRDHVRRIREVDPGTTEGLRGDQLRQESILLNIQRACQSAIDLAHHLAERHGLGTPGDSRDAFAKLERASLVPSELANHLRGMVGFRNIAVHRYHELNLDVLRAILDEHLGDLIEFADIVERLAPPADGQS